MPYDYHRGHQMVILDPRLNNALTTPPTLMDPPFAYNRWRVDPIIHSPQHILAWAGRVARGAPGGRGLDALHLMAHGNRALLQMGSGFLTADNVDLFEPLQGRTRWIVFWSCLIGSDSRGWYRGHPEYFGQQVASTVGCQVVVAHQPQLYQCFGTRLEFGEWEGPVDIFQPDGGWATQQDHNPFRGTRRLDLEAMIFG
jgi:hypothetical protein